MLIVTLWITIALAGLVLTLAFSMRTEAMAAANRISQAQAEAAERGMEQWLLSVVDLELTTPGTIETTPMEGRQIGDCYAWVCQPDYNNDGAQIYGMTDEAGKIDLNTATEDMLMLLPGMTQDVADAILDWRNPNTTVSSMGAEDDYYMSLPQPYHCKNSPYESLDELLLVKGVTPELLYGYDHNRNGIIDDKEGASGNLGTAINAAGDAGVGFAPFVTVYGIQATVPAANAVAATPPAASPTTTIVNVNTRIAPNAVTSPLLTVLTTALSASRAQEIFNATKEMSNATTNGQPFDNIFDFYFKVKLTVDEFTKIYPQITATAPSASPTTAPSPGPTPATTTPKIAKVNINTAPRDVLLCLPGLTDSDADAIISHRQSNTSTMSSSTDPSNIAWLADIIDQAKALSMGKYVTGKSVVFSGDVVAISPDGRAFRRYRVVVSGQTTPAHIVYRRDMTQYGWPLPAEIRDSIRSGQGYEPPLSGGLTQ